MPVKLNIDLHVLEQEWLSGLSAAQLARKYGCTPSQIYKIRSKHNLSIEMKNGNKEPEAPTPLDARMSKASLMPSPWVLARIAELKGIM